MTYRDDPPEAPTCPLCASNDEVQRDTIRGHHIWLCGHCWTAFSGGTDEWEQWRNRRDMYANHKKNQEAS